MKVKLDFDKTAKQVKGVFKNKYSTPLKLNMKVKHLL